MKLIALLVSFVFSTSAFAEQQDTSSCYQLISTQDGRVFRIDKQSGKTVLLEGTSYKNINEPEMPSLEVGKVYRIEDNQMVRYAGKGKLEQWGLDKYYKKE